MTTHKLSITGIDCANCAKNLERHIAKISGLENVSINFMGEKLTFDCEDEKYEDLMSEIKKVIDRVEPDAVLGEDRKAVKHHKHSEECDCGHEHHHEEHHHTHTYTKVKAEITDIDCPHCAGKLKSAIEKIHGLRDVSVNHIAEKLMFTCPAGMEDQAIEEIKKTIADVLPEAKLGDILSKESFEEECHGHHHEEEHHHHSEECDCGHEHHHTAGERNHKMSITGIDCANCAKNLERNIAKINGLENVSINFMQEKLMFDCDSDKYEQLMAEIKKVIAKVEPDAVLGQEEISHTHEHHHEHHHEHNSSCDMVANDSAKQHTGAYKYNIRGIDCANCAAALERQIAKLDCLDNVTITFMNETLSFDVIYGSLEDALSKIKNVISENEPDCYIEEIKTKAKNNIVKKPDHKKEKLRIWFSVSFLLIAIGIKNLIPDGTINFIISGIFYVISYIFVGAPVLKSAFKNLGKGQWMDEKFLMAIATIGAIGTGEFQEGVFVMLLYQIGELFQAMAVESSRQSISELMDIRADEANLKIRDKIVTVDVEEVNVGDIIVIKPGEKVPLDGVVINGTSSINTSALTGESLPRDVEVGDEVVSGCVNMQGLLEVEVTKESDESTVAKILDLVENSSNRKAETENFISSFAKYYTPVVVYSALFVAFIVPAILAGINHVSYLSLLGDYFHRGLMFLVVSCPCAIVISVPLTYFSGIGGLSKKGILVKGSNYLDALNAVDTVVFDKTGTITKGEFSISKIESTIDENELKMLAAYAEINSTHPISKVIVNAFGKENINTQLISSVVETAGHGVEAVIDGKEVLAGNEKLMAMHGIAVPQVNEAGTVVFIAVNDRYAGYLVIADEIKETSAQAMKELKACGIKKTVMLTGDNEKVAKAISEKCGIDIVKSNLLPQDKVTEFDSIAKNGNCAYVGDGINDAPVLAMANVGLAMGGLGSDAAIEAADIVIMNDDLMLIVEAVKGAKKTRKIVMQNIVFSLAVKILILLASAIGITTSMAVAIFGDVGVMLIAVLNAIRALR